MAYDKKKFQKVINNIKNDLQIFCKDQVLLNKNLQKYETYKKFISIHLQKPYDKCDIINLEELEFYVHEIDIILAISHSDFIKAYSVYNDYLAVYSSFEYLEHKIDNKLSAFINKLREKIKNTSNIEQSYVLLKSVRDKIPESRYHELKEYVNYLYVHNIEENISKLVKSRHFEIAFKKIKGIVEDELREKFINQIIENTQICIKTIFEQYNYPECKKEADEIIEKFPQLYLDRIIDTYNFYEKIAKLYGKINSELLKFNFQKADNIYAENATLLDKESYYKKKSEALQLYLKTKWNISVNDEQALSLANFSKNLLVTARAGSGKTRIIACKTILSIETENISPDEILLLSFNRNAAEEMRTRIVDDFGCKKFDKKSARTFHSLAYDIVNPQEELIYDDNDDDVRQKLTMFVNEIYTSKEILTEDFKQNMYDYYLWTSDSVADDYTKYWVFKSDEEKYNYLRGKKKISLNREKVKSNGEKWIADFLFEHGINYKYEKLFTCSQYGVGFGNKLSRLYHPDFTIWNKDNNKTYIIEHWGIDENDTEKIVPKEWNKTWDEYYSEMCWKRKLLDKSDATLIETSICDLKNGRTHFENILKERLKKAGIICRKLTKLEIYKRIEKIYVDEMAKKFSQFILYAQKVNFGPEEIDKRLNNNLFNGDLRCEAFVKMANVIYKKYDEYLVKHKKTDFDHVLVSATEKINATKGNCEISLSNKSQKIKNLKMILIDEYQDFSQLFFNLLSAIIKSNPEIKLFCVGDDWQSINTFAGSDMKFFKKFNEYFLNSDCTSLSYNYRSCKNIVEAGNQVMLKEGEPSKPITNEVGQIKLYFVDDVNIFKDNSGEIDTDFMYDLKSDDKKLFFAVRHRYFKKCIEIISEDVNKSYFIMHRKGRLCGFSKVMSFTKEIQNYFSKKGITVNVTGNTMHKFKGMEADNVIILELTGDEMPLIHPDSDIYMLFNKTPQMILDEERRLFYVALTRAKEKIFILSERSSESSYINFIENYISSSVFDFLDKDLQHFLHGLGCFDF